MTSPIDTLDTALREASTLDQVASAHFKAKQAGLDVAEALNRQATDGSPLLTNWLERQLARPGQSFRDRMESRQHMLALFWQLVDSGFNVRTRWILSPFPGQTTPHPRDLLDIAVSLGDLEFLGKLEKRWGGPIEATDLEPRRVLAPIGSVYPVEPLIHSKMRLGKDGTPMVKWLLKRGVDPNQRDSHGRNALAYAQTLEHVSLFIKAGMDPFWRDKKGKTSVEHWLVAGKPMTYAATALAGQPPEAHVGLRQAIVEEAISRGEFLTSHLRSVLTSLKPVLGEPMALENGTHATLTDIAQRQMWETSRRSLSEIGCWLLKNGPRGSTPDQGLSAHRKLELAIWAMDLAQLSKAKVKLPPLDQWWADIVIQAGALETKTENVLTPATWRLARAVLEQRLFKDSSRNSEDLAQLQAIFPTRADWDIQGHRTGFSGLSNAFSTLAQVMEIHPYAWIQPTELAQTAGALKEWIDRGFVTPLDTLEPVLWLLAQAPVGLDATGPTPAMVAGERPASPNWSGSLPTALGFWVNCVLQEHGKDSLLQVDPDKLEALFANMAGAPASWSAWSANLRAHVMDHRLETGDDTLANKRRLRM